MSLGAIQSMSSHQGSIITVSDSLGPVNFSVRQADFIGHLPDRQALSTIFMA